MIGLVFERHGGGLADSQRLQTGLGSGPKTIAAELSKAFVRTAARLMEADVVRRREPAQSSIRGSPRGGRRPGYGVPGERERRVQYVQGDPGFSGRFNDVASFQRPRFSGCLTGPCERGSAEFDADGAGIILCLQELVRPAS